MTCIPESWEAVSPRLGVWPQWGRVRDLPSLSASRALMHSVQLSPSCSVSFIDIPCLQANIHLLREQDWSPQRACNKLAQAAVDMSRLSCRLLDVGQVDYE